MANINLTHWHRFVWPVWSPPDWRDSMVVPRCVNKRCKCGEEAVGLGLEERTELTIIPLPERAAIMENS